MGSSPGRGLELVSPRSAVLSHPDCLLAASKVIIHDQHHLGQAFLQNFNRGMKIQVWCAHVSHRTRRDPRERACSVSRDPEAGGKFRSSTGHEPMRFILTSGIADDPHLADSMDSAETQQHGVEQPHPSPEAKSIEAGGTGAAVNRAQPVKKEATPESKASTDDESQDAQNRDVEATRDATGDVVEQQAAEEKAKQDPVPSELVDFWQQGVDTTANGWRRVKDHGCWYLNESTLCVTQDGRAVM